MADLKVGDKVWQHVERRYRLAGWKTEDEFHALTIVAETKVSWVAKESEWMEYKFPKKKPVDEYIKDPETRLAKGRRGETTRIYTTWASVEREVWLIKNRWHLRKFLEELVIVRSTAEELRQLAAMVGYKDQP